MTFRGFGWTWIDLFRGSRLIGSRNKHHRLSSLHAKFEAFLWVMQGISHQQICNPTFVTNYKNIVMMIDWPHEWPSFSAELLKFSCAFFKNSCIVSFVSWGLNSKFDHLVRFSRTCFIMFFVGVYIPLWIVAPTLVWIIERPFDVKKKKIHPS